MAQEGAILSFYNGLLLLGVEPDGIRVRLRGADHHLPAGRLQDDAVGFGFFVAVIGDIDTVARFGLQILQAGCVEGNGIGLL